MVVLIILLVSTLYFCIIAPFFLSNVAFVQEIVYILLVLVPATNFIYGLVAWRRAADKRKLAEKWKKILLITKVVLIPFYVVNFILWVLATLVGIVPVFMFLLVLAPLMGIIFTYWIFLSTVTYAVAIFKEYHNGGYYPKWLFIILLISQFIFVIDILGVVALEILIRINKRRERNVM